MTGDGPLVVREKSHAAAPMTLEQALYEMELVGHDFYLFVDKESEKPSVVYRRRGYDYGVDFARRWAERASLDGRWRDPNGPPQEWSGRVPIACSSAIVSKWSLRAQQQLSMPCASSSSTTRSSSGAG